MSNLSFRLDLLSAGLTPIPSINFFSSCLTLQPTEGRKMNWDSLGAEAHRPAAFISGKAVVRDAARAVLLSFIKKQNWQIEAAAATDTGPLMKHLSLCRHV